MCGEGKFKGLQERPALYVAGGEVAAGDAEGEGLVRIPWVAAGGRGAEFEQAGRKAISTRSPRGRDQTRAISSRRWGRGSGDADVPGAGEEPRMSGS